MSATLSSAREHKRRIQLQYAHYAKKHASADVTTRAEDRNLVRLIRRQLKELNIDRSHWGSVIQKATLNGLSQLSRESEFLMQFMERGGKDSQKPMKTEKGSQEGHMSGKRGTPQEQSRNQEQRKSIEKVSQAPVTRVFRKPSSQWRLGVAGNIAEALSGWGIGGSDDSIISNASSHVTVLDELIGLCGEESSVEDAEEVESTVRESVDETSTTSSAKSKRRGWRTPVKELGTVRTEGSTRPKRLRNSETQRHKVDNSMQRRGSTPQRTQRKEQVKSQQQQRSRDDQEASPVAWVIPSERPRASSRQTKPPVMRARASEKRPHTTRRRLRRPKPDIKFGLPYDLSRVQSRIKGLIERDRRKLNAQDYGSSPVPQMIPQQGTNMARKRKYEAKNDSTERFNRQQQSNSLSLKAQIEANKDFAGHLNHEAMRPELKSCELSAQDHSDRKGIQQVKSSEGHSNQADGDMKRTSAAFQSGLEQSAAATTDWSSIVNGFISNTLMHDFISDVELSDLN